MRGREGVVGMYATNCACLTGIGISLGGETDQHAMVTIAAPIMRSMVGMEKSTDLTRGRSTERWNWWYMRKNWDMTVTGRRQVEG